MSSIELRFAATTAVTWGVLALMKPPGQYTSDGKARPFSLWSADKEATPLPTYVVASLMGFFSVILL